MKPKVLFVSHAADFGGAEIFLRDILIEAESKKLHWSALFLQNGPIAEELKLNNVDVMKYNLNSNALSLKRDSKLKSVLWSLLGLAIPVVRASKLFMSFDLICANSQKALFVGGSAAFIARKPFLWIVHDLLDDKSFSPTLRTAAVFFAKKFVRSIIANSEATKLSLVKCGIDPKKIVVVYNGFKFERSVDDVNANNEKEETLRLLGLKRATTVGLFGRITPWKGQHVLIDAMRRLEDVQAIIVGGPTYEDEGYFINIKEKVKLMNMEHRIKFTGFRKDINHLIRTVDIVVHTSIAPEPFGRVIVEGMAQRRPVIGTRGGGVNEIITNGSTGILVDPADPSALTAAINQLISNPALSEGIAFRAQEMVLNNFSIEKTMIKLNEVFNSIKIP